MKKSKVLVYFIITLLNFILITLSDALREDQISLSERKLKEKPIVIHTQARHYDQPTLSEYQLCHENLEKCYQVCESTANRRACEAECPTCPILMDHDIVIQGVNDTDLHAPVETSVNTTNVIKLTNEIRNVIENNMGNVTARNENNVHVHNNISTTGGRFGFGYNEKGSCCLVVRRSKSCDSPKFSTGSRCHHKRLRVCGERCKSRVMYAKRVKYCNDDKGNGCYSRISYVPYHKYHAPRCHFNPVWPFVSCDQRQSYSSSCHQCLQLSYGYILNNGVPAHCVPCYRSINTINSNTAIFGGEPEIQYPTYFDWRGDFTPNGDNWHVVKKKCRQLDGSIIDCGGDSDLDTEYPYMNISDRPVKEGTSDDLDYPEDEANNDIFENDYADETHNSELNKVEFERSRRHSGQYILPKFQRSAYSHRNVANVRD